MSVTRRRRRRRGSLRIEMENWSRNMRRNIVATCSKNRKAI